MAIYIVYLIKPNRAELTPVNSGNILQNRINKTKPNPRRFYLSLSLLSSVKTHTKALSLSLFSKTRVSRFTISAFLRYHSFNYKWKQLRMWNARVTKRCRRYCTRLQPAQPLFSLLRLPPSPVVLSLHNPSPYLVSSLEGLRPPSKTHLSVPPPDPSLPPLCRQRHALFLQTVPFCPGFCRKPVSSEQRRYGSQPLSGAQLTGESIVLVEETSCSTPNQTEVLALLTQWLKTTLTEEKMKSQWGWAVEIDGALTEAVTAIQIY